MSPELAVKLLLILVTMTAAIFGTIYVMAVGISLVKPRQMLKVTMKLLRKMPRVLRAVRFTVLETLLRLWVNITRWVASRSEKSRI